MDDNEVGCFVLKRGEHWKACPLEIPFDSTGVDVNTLKRTLFVSSLAVWLIAGTGCGGGDNPISSGGLMAGNWTVCLSPTTNVAVSLNHSPESSSFTGVYSSLAGSLPLAGGVVHGSDFQFGVESEEDGEGIVFLGRLDESGRSATGTWVYATFYETIILSGEFQMVRVGEPLDEHACQVVPIQHYPDLRIEGQLSVSGDFSTHFSGVVKNYGLAAAENPSVVVYTYDQNGHVLSVSSSIFVALYLRHNESATFNVYGGPSRADIENIEIYFNWEGQQASTKPSFNQFGLNLEKEVTLE